MNMIETYQFIRSRNSNLYSVLYRPERNDKKTGILFVDPIFEEKLWAQRICVNTARRLCSEGYSVLRFDYSGNGDSTGAYRDNTIVTYMDDLRSAQQFILEHAELERLYLLGIRFGSLIISRSINELQPINGLIFIEPVLNSNDYIMDCLRSNLTSQMVLYKKVKYPREVLLAEVMRGNVVDIAGYELTPEFYQSAAGIDLATGLREIQLPVWVGTVVRNAAVPPGKPMQEVYEKIKINNSRIELQNIVTEPFWLETRKIDTEPEDLFNKISQWLQKQLQGIE